MPRMSEQGSKAGLASPKIFRKAVGCSYSEYGRRFEEFARWTAEKCMAAVDRFVQNNGRRPRLQSEANLSSGLPGAKAFLRYTGMTMGAYVKSMYPDLPTTKSLELPAPQKCGSVWTTDRIIAATDRFMETYGRYPNPKEYSMKYGLPTRNTIVAHFGIPAGVYWKQRYPMAKQGWTAELILQAFERFIREHGRLPLTKELQTKNGLMAHTTVERYTGVKSYSEFCRTYYPEYTRSESWNRESCIQALERFLKENGRYPTQKEHYQHEYLPAVMTFRYHVGETPHQYCERQHPEQKHDWTKSRAIEALEEFIARNGRPPLAVEFCSANQLPVCKTFARVVGMPVGLYLHERYQEYYAQAGQKQIGGQTMRML